MLEGKNLRCWLGRSDLIGDTIMALPVLDWAEKKYPGSYKYWSILRKCSQAAPLYFNHPLIDKIVISDHDEGFGETDRACWDQCQVRMNTRPQHPFGEQWHNNRSMMEETWVMAGLPIEDIKDFSKEKLTPKLYKWFDTPRYEKTIALHCFAGYGFDNHRSPTVEWWEKTIKLLVANGYRIIRLGHPREPYLNGIVENADLRDLPFMNQVKEALGTDLYIGTDSGMSLVMGAYRHNQITLLTNWNIGHTINPYCLAPVNDNNFNFFAEMTHGGCSAISNESVLDKAIKMI